MLESRQRLEDATGVPVRWYAYPYGYLPGREGRAVARAYAGACAGGPAGSAPAPTASPCRADAHYLRRPGLLDRALKGRDAYLRMRHLGRGVRRLLRPTTAKAEARGALGRVCRFGLPALATMIAVADRRAAAFFDLDKTLMEERQRPGIRARPTARGS